VRIWTIQPADLYEKLKAKQVLFADGRRHDRDRVWAFAYRWMADQMHRRLPPSKARFPWWGWYRYLGLHRPKPDLRAAGHLPDGQKGVRIELEINDREVLLSNFGDWHCVLNDSFLSRDEVENDQFDRERGKLAYTWGQYPEPLRSKVIASWERIFDIGIRERDGRGRYCEKGIQATFWELRFKDVTDVTFFTAR